MKTIAWSAAASAALVVLSAGAAYAADMDTMVTKAPPPAATAPASCGSLYDFIGTACPLSWYGVTFFGTVDIGGAYETHGVPFDPNHPTGQLYVLGAGGTNADRKSTRLNSSHSSPSRMPSSA